MIPCKPSAGKLTLFLLSLFVFSTINTIGAQDIAKGKALFNSKCASCHFISKPSTGPALAGLEERHKWADHNELLKWINNPAAYILQDAYTQGLLAQYGSMMTGFPDITLKDVDDLVAYINSAAIPPTPTPDQGGTEGAKKDNSNAVILVLFH